MDRVVEGDQPHPCYRRSRHTIRKAFPSTRPMPMAHILAFRLPYDGLLRSSSFLYLVPLAVISSANPLSVI